MAKKILFINTTFKGGGAASVAQDLFKYFNQNGFDIYFAYGRGQESQNEKTFKFGNAFETFLHIFLVRFLGLEGYGNYFSTKKLINYIKEGKFDLIHLHNLHGYYLNFYQLIPFLNDSGIKVIWSLYDEWALNPLYAHSINNYSYPKTYNKLLFNFWFKKKQDAFKSLKNLTIICSAKWLYDKVQKSYLKDLKSVLIKNGVDLSLFQPTGDKSTLRKKYNLPINKKIILFGVCNLRDENKGIHYILEVANSLKERNYLFLGVGKGMTSENENIKIMPYISDRHALAEIFQASDLFCLTSLAETESLVSIEALASGLPVVAFDIPATRELINDKIGLLVPVGNVPMLSQALVSSFEGKSIAQFQESRNEVISRLSLDNSLASYKSLYEEILK